MINIDELKTCEWEDIEVGEVFGADGCFAVLVKTGEEEARVIECDDHYYGSWCYHTDLAGEEVRMWYNSISGGMRLGTKDEVLSISAANFHYYKLPKTLQKMFVSNLDTLGLIE